MPLRELSDMAAPDTLQLNRHRDLSGRLWHIWVRRFGMVLVAVLPILGLFSLFGQRPATSSVTAPAASLKVYGATHLRGGLLYMTRFTIVAHRELKRANVILSSGWAESITINTIEPSPVGEGSSHGKLVFTLGHIPAGGKYVLFMDFQVNPTNIGHRAQDVTLADGSTALATIHRTVTVYP